MDSQVYQKWQQWESRIQTWLNESDDELDLSETLPFDRIILTVLAVKYQILYKDMEKEARTTKANKSEERKSVVKLSKVKAPIVEQEQERHRDKEKCFESFTGRLLSPEQVIAENSIEWQDFNQLYEWHGLAFLHRFLICLPKFIIELIATTNAYQEFIDQPKMTTPVVKIDNDVYQKKHNGHIFLSIDMKSANFASLQHIHAIDAQTYPTWSDFLSAFVGSRPLMTQSKVLRMRCLGKLPQYFKLEALWTHFTATIYKTVLLPYFDEIEEDTRCVALVGDEVVFHLDSSFNEDKIKNIIENIQNRLAKTSPIFKFQVQAYRLQTFIWQGKHTCFARLFIGQSEKKNDLKCVPDKDRNYDRAYADFQSFLSNQS